MNLQNKIEKAQAAIRNAEIKRYEKIEKTASMLKSAAKSLGMESMELLGIVSDRLTTDEHFGLLLSDYDSEEALCESVA